MTRDMKDSGIEWIGEIPSDWSISKLKYVASIIGGNGFPEYLQGEDTDEIPFYKAGDISAAVRKISDSRTYISRIIADKHRFNLIPSGAILMPKIGEAMKKNSRALSTKICCIDNNCQAIVPSNQVEQDYCYYLLCIVDMNDFDNAGTIPSLNNSKLLNLQIPFPPKKTQHAIANYLDSKCSQIDALIANTEAQIASLGEYKKALITQAVTKGLDPDVEMKDSGIAWVGNMPKEWETVPAKSMFMQRNDKGNKYVLQLLSPTQKFGVIPQSLYEEKTGQNAVKLDEKTNLSALKTVHKGDYCISLRSFQGGFELSDYEGVVSPAYQVFYPIKAVGQRYYKYLFKTQRFINEMNSYTMSLRDGKNIAFADFGKSYIPVPPLSEQKRIGNYLDLKCSQIDALIQTKSKTLNVLQEYKKSLILDYVTGKKEVPDSYRKDGCHE